MNIIETMKDTGTTAGVVNKIAQTAATAAGLALLVSVKKDTKYTRKGIDRVETKIDSSLEDLKVIRKQNVELKRSIDDLFAFEEAPAQTAPAQTAPSQTAPAQQVPDYTDVIQSMTSVMTKILEKFGDKDQDASNSSGKPTKTGDTPDKTDKGGKGQNKSDTK